MGSPDSADITVAPVLSPPRLLLLGLAVSALLFAASGLLRALRPAFRDVPAAATGSFQPDGWHPGEPLASARGVRAWGSWSGSDENTGTLALGPFPAPERLQFAVTGYPARPGLQLFVENPARGAQHRLDVADVHERWQVVALDLPPAWRGEPVVLHARDAATAHAGWFGLTEPVRGGLTGSTVTLLRALALLLPGALLVWLPIRAPAPPATRSRGLAVAPWLAAALALVPFAWCARSFADLWWFGDDWDLLERIDRIGFWRWTLEPFAENFVPLFKLLWGGLVFASGGSYLPMIAILWLTHAANVALLARLLRAAGFGSLALAATVVVFALSSAHVETLAWSVQWSALLALTFFLLAANWLLPRLADGRAARGTSLLVLALLSAASALAFARGVLTGAALAAVSLLPWGAARLPGRHRWLPAAACLLPALAVALTIYLTSPGNHRALGGHALDAVRFGLAYWAATPLHRLLDLGAWNPDTAILLGCVKLPLLLWALRRASGAARPVLVLLLLLDLGNAVLLGLGRHQTGLPAANSERYQYNAQLCTLPALALAFEAAVAAVAWPRVRRALAVVLLVALAWRAARGWPAAAEGFAAHRGRNTRELLLRHPAPPAEGAVPGIPFLRTDRARELIVIYHLH